MKEHLKLLIISLILVFAPIKATLVSIMVITFIDLASGLVAARKRKEPITSSGLKRTIIKIGVYELTVMLGFLTEQYMTGDLVPVVKVLAGFIGLTELKSVLENVEEITGVAVVKALVDKVAGLNK